MVHSRRVLTKSALLERCHREVLLKVRHDEQVGNNTLIVTKSSAACKYIETMRSMLLRESDIRETTYGREQS